MAILDKSKKLKKELTLLNVYAIGTGTTLSAGFFLLPGMAAAQAGPAMILSYMLAAVPLIPAMFCMMELATAMPRAGGTYYFLDRSMGPMIGTIGGLGTWFSLMLKTSFALIGMGAYINLFISGNYIIPIAVVFALFYGGINLFGAKESGKIQVFLVAGILIILGGFIGGSFTHVNPANFSSFLDEGGQSILATAGLVYISYVGITNIASVAEEIKDPEKNLPLGMFLSFLTTIVIYGLGTYIMVGIVPLEELKVSLTPVALSAEYVFGWWGKILVSIAAIFAFSSVTNAAILSASRYPLAMSRDHLIPAVFRKFNKQRVPIYGILITLVMILVFILFLNPLKIAKLASAFQLMMFALCCLAVIIMRESHIEAYDPGYRAPFYPWLQIIGILTPSWLIIEMGWMPLTFSLGLAGVGVLWYFYYARHRVERSGAILHIFERLGRQRNKQLDPELRSILKEKGLREDDPFDKLISHALVIRLEKEEPFDIVIKQACEIMAQQVSYPSKKLEQNILEGTKIGATPVSHGVALPHLRLHHIIEPVLLIIHSKPGIRIDMDENFWGEHMPDGPIHAVFFLISPEEKPKQHLRILANIASRVDDENFMKEWINISNEDDLKELLLREEHVLSLKILSEMKSAVLINKTLKEIKMPPETLIAAIRRSDGETIVPSGNKMILEGDLVTVIGDLKGIQEFSELYGKRT